MKLHANAALSLNKRRLLVHRVVEDGWPLTKAAVWVAVRCASETQAEVTRSLPPGTSSRSRAVPLAAPARREERRPPKSPDFHGYGRFLSIGLPALEVPVAA